jgi:hypothetical protein
MSSPQARPQFRSRADPFAPLALILFADPHGESLSGSPGALLVHQLASTVHQTSAPLRISGGSDACPLIELHQPRNKTHFPGRKNRDLRSLILLVSDGRGASAVGRINSINSKGKK